MYSKFHCEIKAGLEKLLGRKQFGNILKTVSKLRQFSEVPSKKEREICMTYFYFLNRLEIFGFIRKIALIALDFDQR